jgi:hypothetical protein
MTVHSRLPEPTFVSPGDHLTLVLHRNAVALPRDPLEWDAARDRVDDGSIEVAVLEPNLIPDVRFPDVQGVVDDPWVSVWRGDTLLCMTAAIPAQLTASMSFTLRISVWVP